MASVIKVARSRFIASSLGLKFVAAKWRSRSMEDSSEFSSHTFFKIQVSFLGRISTKLLSQLSGQHSSQPRHEVTIHGIWTALGEFQVIRVF